MGLGRCRPAFSRRRAQRRSMQAAVGRSLWGRAGQWHRVAGTGRRCGVHTVLGIESTCDDSGAAVVTADGAVRAECVSSQIHLHAKYGGVVPNLAAREHGMNLLCVLDACFDRWCVPRPRAPQSRRRPDTQPFMQPSVGSRRDRAGSGPWAAAMPRRGSRRRGQAQPAAPGARLRRKPPRSAHTGRDTGCAWRRRRQLRRACPLAALAPLRPSFAQHPQLAFPFVTLLASGGHCMLVLSLGVGNHRVLGATLDDSAGEAFDKVARLLLPHVYPTPRRGVPSHEHDTGDASTHAARAPAAIRALGSCVDATNAAHGGSRVESLAARAGASSWPRLPVPLRGRPVRSTLPGGTHTHRCTRTETDVQRHCRTHAHRCTYAQIRIHTDTDVQMYRCTDVQIHCRTHTPSTHSHVHPHEHIPTS